MAISDHAISDRAISAPEDVVVVGVTIPGRCVGRARAVNECEGSDAPAGDALAFTGPAGTVDSFDFSAVMAAGSHAPTGSVTVESFPI